MLLRSVCSVFLDCFMMMHGFEDKLKINGEGTMDCWPCTKLSFH